MQDKKVHVPHRKEAHIMHLLPRLNKTSNPIDQQILGCIFQIYADTAKVQLDKKLYSLKWMWEFAPPNAKLSLSQINDNKKDRKRKTKRQQK